MRRAWTSGAASARPSGRPLQPCRILQHTRAHPVGEGLQHGVEALPLECDAHDPSLRGSQQQTAHWGVDDAVPHIEQSALVEIFQACRGNYEGPGAFRQYSDAIVDGTFTIDGLLRGHRFGLIASSDHGHGASYVGVGPVFAKSRLR